MRTIVLNCSNKKRLSNSSYFSGHLKSLLKGDKLTFSLRKKYYSQIIDAIKDCNNIVISLPVYVDGVPSNVLDFFDYLKENNIIFNKDIKVYVISNCGFYEGRQNKYNLEIIENFCEHINVTYGGGLGIGAGEMFGTVRIFNVLLALLIVLIEFIIGTVKLIKASNFSFLDAIKSIEIISPIINISLIFIFNLLMYISMIRLAKKINKGQKITNFYTTVLCPRFLFVIFADIFWILRALFNGVMLPKMYKKSKIGE